MDSQQPRTGAPVPALRRALRARHLTMIAIGGSIGTGLFVASGATIAQAGPGGALVAYLLVGAMVYFLMTSLGELAAYMPVSGSFATYGALYVDEGFGFALGWNYWYNWAVTIAVELAAAQLVMQYWFPHTPGILWSALFLAAMFLLNAISVRGFGEAEYWCALVKVVTVVAFIGIGLLMIFGILRGDAGGMPAGLANLTIGDAPFVGGLPAMIGVAMIAGFSFQGTELIGVAAGESAEPAKSIPRAVRQVFWRILLFYVLAILIIGILVPYTDPSLLKSDVQTVGVSPFTLVFRHAGLAFAAGVMNAVILTAVLSAGNSGMYASTRMLYNLATEGRAPRVFARLTRNGVPMPALLATTAVGALCFLTSLFESQSVYLWLLNLSGMTGFIAWLGIAISHYRFRKGFVAKGLDLSRLPYRSPFFPYGPLFAFALCMVITLGQNYQAFTQGRVDWLAVAATYVGIPVFLLIWLGYRLVRKTRIVPYAAMHFPPLPARATGLPDAGAAAAAAE
ncbi:gamma-aminobutyrate permease [Cupriavidus sp. USMAA2-4]|uniref:Gamma-aminobutyrate permease n=1 Tax=Cupriavidus malaysiensis TaxID=367825 RepID=A0ABM6FES6_9BURK|nr:MULTISPECIES: amino acid permease [Cupriavidus]AOY94884.1 gamma-aminobutyrate permease [Cupriavidus sp. USMAA2-4]AOZ02239.1 gamma-aminobutyrate permease [Cupriavidus sp. USMAHM13]AOZ10383.1 gamma-aminobutyrate permease [Cupriavidus malaysiensis]